MIEAIIYKEFLKTYKVILFFGVFILCSLLFTYVDIKNIVSELDVTYAILEISFKGKFNFNNLNIICLVFSATLAIAQYYPEVTNARIRLFLHLPMSHFKLITTLISIGLVFLFFVYFIIGIAYYFLITAYYPYEIFEAIFSKLISTFILSLLWYLTVVLCSLEPKLVRKIVYILISFLIFITYFSLSQREFFSSYILNYVMIGTIFIYILSIYEVFTSYTKGYIK